MAELDRYDTRIYQNP